ncbi:MAG: hypothetical protein JNL09_06525 [Anaerolineales bacterium]|nr:hypothetical protein [Anaerolineales bacterium]
MLNPPKTRGLAFGLGALVVALALSGLAFYNLRTLAPTFGTFVWLCVALVSVPTTLWVGYRCWGLLTARYVFSAQALTVIWGERREVIPLADIEYVHPATEYAGELKPRGLNWPGSFVSRVAHPELGAVEFLATSAEKADLVMVAYSGGWLALSPANPADFLQTFEAHRNPQNGETPETEFESDDEAEAPPAPVEAASVLPDLWQWPLWQDRLALTLIAVSGLAWLVQAGYVFFLLPQLPAEIVLRFRPDGTPFQVGAPVGLLILPAISAVAWALNTLLGMIFHRQPNERTIAYILLFNTFFVSGLTWLATLSLLTAG